MRLLLVDDHALFRDGVALLLKELDPAVQVVHASNVAEALAVLGASTDIDLILLDAILPGVHGLQALETLRERYPDVPLVMLSSQEDQATVLRSIQLGAMGFIPKSASSEQMFEALRTVLAHGIYVPPLGLSGIALPAPARPCTHPAELGLTQRQTQVLWLILEGKPMKSIARELGMSHNTAKTHVSAVLRALAVTTRTQAIVAAHRMGLVLGD
ncbi:MAG TPA: response regulator transcription factor [Ottowia sp.]|uniref:response regulator transcription factor n=1 Tax=Ottowia sp. TaxID=1898956 RepID=UPI002B96D18E|nr:response regulator transcription factor [Ottowia sp.]HMN20383.1 response regulator transcription factor [Ottowia sp.]